MNQRAGVRFEPLSPRWNSAWRAHYLRYAEAVNSPADDAIATTVWSWLLAHAHGLEGIVALDGDEIAGFAHFRPFPRTLDGNEACFLDDVWVAERHRGRGVAQALIAEVATIARQRGWTHVRWVTETDNLAGQRVYEKVAKRMDLLTYRLDTSDRR